MPVKGLKAPGSFQYLNPNLSWVGPPPNIITNNKMINPMTIKTFKQLNQNSNSPNTLTPKTFIMTINIIKQAIQTPGLTVSLETQYCITNAPAVI
ncbi:hypothetical protein WICMUC_001709 [Wickerhamomyces mucosus]|uniref:Uncharacterized protein n=1 Tax=Wickerhamomyces mucosus TaxID=1378264 RepID=A0A9P8PSS9_9ASCO|nr:hypothetical protein WICMUC_001709 [Wickerhamomyces mucosus]